MSNNKALIGGGLLLGFTLLSSAVLSAPLASAETTGGVDLTVTIPTNCSLTATNNNLAKTINPGQYDTIGTANLKALCNDANGFAIYAVGLTDDVYGKNVLSTSLTNGGDNYDIVSGTAESGDTSNWAMQLTAVEGDYAPTIVDGFDDFSIIPTTYTKVASFDSNTDGSIGGNFTATYAAYISSAQPASAYQGKVKFTLIHPGVDAGGLDQNLLIYVINATDCRLDDVAPQPERVSILSGERIYLNGVNCGRPGYGLASWNTKADGTGANFAVRQEVNYSDYVDYIDQENHTLTLYANWVPAEEGVTMQTFDDTQEPYASANINTVIALRDERDNDTYAVGKLADGKWWMIENLRIDGSVDANTMASGSQGIGGAFTKLPSSVDAGWLTNTTNDVYGSSFNLTTDTLPQINTMNIHSATQDRYSSYQYGTHYSWAAASATTEAFVNTTNTYSTSICPKGWHLPYGLTHDDRVNEFYTLFSAVLGVEPTDNVGTASASWTGEEYVDTLRGYPNNFILSGNYNDDFGYNRGNVGFYWSSYGGSTNSGLRGIAMRINRQTYQLRPVGGLSARNQGYSVRCIAD